VSLADPAVLLAGLVILDTSSLYVDRRHCSTLPAGAPPGTSAFSLFERGELERSKSRIRRSVTATDSIAAPRSKVEPEMLRASTRTVLFDQTAASSSMKRVEEASDTSPWAC
jgi:hypothetical protein